jgi:hypothetical protein
MRERSPKPAHQGGCSQFVNGPLTLRFQGKGTGQASEGGSTNGETSIWLAGYLIDDGVLVSIDNCGRVESLPALARRLAGVLP